MTTEILPRNLYEVFCFEYRKGSLHKNVQALLGENMPLYEKNTMIDTRIFTIEGKKMLIVTAAPRSSELDACLTSGIRYSTATIELARRGLLKTGNRFVYENELVDCSNIITSVFPFIDKTSTELAPFIHDDQPSLYPGLFKKTKHRIGVMIAFCILTGTVFFGLAIFSGEDATIRKNNEFPVNSAKGLILAQAPLQKIISFNELLKSDLLLFGIDGSIATAYTFTLDNGVSCRTAKMSGGNPEKVRTSASCSIFTDTQIISDISYIGSTASFTLDVTGTLQKTPLIQINESSQHDFIKTTCSHFSDNGIILTVSGIPESPEFSFECTDLMLPAALMHILEFGESGYNRIPFFSAVKSDSENKFDIRFSIVKIQTDSKEIPVYPSANDIRVFFGCTATSQTRIINLNTENETVPGSKADTKDFLLGQITTNKTRFEFVKNQSGKTIMTQRSIHQ